jgi:hypothetical protein
MSNDMSKFCRDEHALLNECARIGPTGINSLNFGRANFATTYSTDFCLLVADLLLLYKNHRINNPIYRLSEKFRDLKIRSCRGSDMSYERVEYMLTNSVSKLEKTSTYRVLHLLTKSKCPVCCKWKSGLEQHIKDAHHDTVIQKPSGAKQW